MVDNATGQAGGPQEECDLVMKGGIASGIVYPPLVLQLKDRYRFRAIGGTSAGAIAAAAAAAAEYGREAGGFDKLQAMQDELSRDGFLRDLFQPTERLAPLVDLALRVLDKHQRGVPAGRLALWLLGAALRQPWPQLRSRPACAGLLVGLGVALVLVLLPVPALLFTGGRVTPAGVLLGLALLGLPLGRFGAVLGALAVLVASDLPGHGFGLCSGRADAAAGGGAREHPGAALTDWLDARLNDLAGLAGRGRPLTFGDLEDGPPGGRRIALRMFTSNLSQHRPCVLPLEDQLFAFNRAELQRYFPDAVVQAMADAVPAPGSLRSRIALPPGWCFFPEPRELPVIVATRMSLSFPLLLSAVPLYGLPAHRVQAALQATAPVAVAEAELQRNWFSDGGICSNFPLQFFDGWLPARPTFGVHLTARPDGCGVALAGDPGQPGAQGPGLGALQDVYLPTPGALPATPWVRLDGSLPCFLWSVLTTAQAGRDTGQALLPGQHERIVQVRLGPDEGGLHLVMSPGAVRGVIAKGERAGQVLLRDFDFDQHFWVRFRVLTQQLEAGLAQMRARLQPREGYPQAALLQGYPFVPEPAQELSRWCQEAQLRLTHLDIVLQQWEASEPAQLFAAPPQPAPAAALRVAPKA